MIEGVQVKCTDCIHKQEKVNDESEPRPVRGYVNAYQKEIDFYCDVTWKAIEKVNRICSDFDDGNNLTLRSFI